MIRGDIWPHFLPGNKAFMPLHYSFSTYATASESNLAAFSLPHVLTEHPGYY